MRFVWTYLYFVYDFRLDFALPCCWISNMGWIELLNDRWATSSSGMIWGYRLALLQILRK